MLEQFRISGGQITFFEFLQKGIFAKKVNCNFEHVRSQNEKIMFLISDKGIFSRKVNKQVHSSFNPLPCGIRISLPHAGISGTINQKVTKLLEHTYVGKCRGFKA